MRFDGRLVSWMSRLPRKLQKVEGDFYSGAGQRTLDGGIIFVDEMTLYELNGKARFADTSSSNDHQFVFAQELERHENISAIEAVFDRACWEYQETRRFKLTLLAILSRLQGSCRVRQACVCCSGSDFVA